MCSATPKCWCCPSAPHKATHSHHRFRRHANLLKVSEQQVTAQGSEQVWVADITYLPTAGACAYLSLVTDPYSRKIVGWHVHGSLQTKEVAQAYKQAMRHRRCKTHLVHHSDRGVQYCAQHYQNLHQKYHNRCSMTDGNDC